MDFKLEWKVGFFPQILKYSHISSFFHSDWLIIYQKLWIHLTSYLLQIWICNHQVILQMLNPLGKRRIRIVVNCSTLPHRWYDQLLWAPCEHVHNLINVFWWSRCVWYVFLIFLRSWLSHLVISLWWQWVFNLFFNWKWHVFRFLAATIFELLLQTAKSHTVQQSTLIAAQYEIWQCVIAVGNIIKLS